MTIRIAVSERLHILLHQIKFQISMVSAMEVRHWLLDLKNYQRPLNLRAGRSKNVASH